VSGDVAPARLVLAGATANLAVGTLFAWSLVARDAARDDGLGGGAAAGVFGTAIAVFGAVLLALGPLERRAGPRRLLCAAAVLAAAGLLLAAGVRGPVALFGGIAVLFGVANGLGYGVAVGLAARVPADRRRGTATGLVVAAYAAGPVLLGLVAPPVLAAVGWRPCMAGLAGIVAVLLLVAAEQAPARTARPAGRRDAPARIPGRPVLLLWLVFATGAAPGLALFGQAAPLAAERGLGTSAAGLAVAALALGNLGGRLAAGWWSDRIGRPAALISALVVAAVAVGCLAGPLAPAVVLAGFLGSGLAYGALSSLVPAATADRVGAGAFATAYGRVFTGWGIAGLVAPVAMERLLRLADGRPALVLLAAVPLVPAGIAVLLLARR
jgi:OFA family oxalate/formate antiporter-like MFS transporter